MNRRSLPVAARIVFAAVALASAGVALAADAPVRRPASPCPDRVILTWQTDPAHSQAVTWRTDTSVTAPRVQYARASAGPDVETGALSQTAVTSVVETATTRALSHSANMTGLQPDTVYAYRVGDGTHWSEWHQFRTAAARPAPFTFIYLGDEQSPLQSALPRVLRQAVRQAPDARFIVHTGDLTNRSNLDEEWADWHDMGGWVNATMPSVPTPGNHHYARPAGDATAPPVFSALWRPQFALPENGPPGLAETAYWFDYQGMRVISLNSCEQQQAQVPWLTGVLANNPNRWTVVIFHHPIYSGATRRDNRELREMWQPVFDRHHVDLVLQGHDHVYLRTRSGSGKSSPAPVYILSVAGPKQYDLQSRPNAQRIAEDTQLYQIVSVDDHMLRFAAYTAAGDLYDRFELHKRAGGSVTLRDTLPRGAPERRRAPASSTSR